MTEGMRHMPRHDTMKCIFCFRKLAHTDICFETIDELKDLEPDEIKLGFQRLTDPYMDEYDTQAMSRQPIVRYKENDPDFEVDPETGIPVAWNQPMEGSSFRLKSKKRVCAHCHMPLPSQFGRRPNVLIGFCGNTGSGKTVYMLSLIHDLHARIHSMAVSPDPIFYSQLKTDYEGMYNAMYQDQSGYRLPIATLPTETLSPLVLNCSCGGTDFMITLYDMAGEGVKDPAYMAKQALFLENSDGVIFLKDPDYFPGMPNASAALVEHAHMDNLFDMITKHARIAITMTKIDKLLDMYGANPEFKDIVGNMFDRDESIHANGFDAPAAHALNGRMFRLYNWANTHDQSILNVYTHQRKTEAHAQQPEKQGLLARLFGRGKKNAPQTVDPADQWVMLFGASPLGRSMELYHEPGDSSTWYASQAPSGLHNVDPVLWLLYCAGIFPGKKYED